MGIPILLMAGAEGKISSTSGVLVFAGMPILMLASGASTADTDLRLLPFGLCGIAGLLVLLPFQAPKGGSGMLALGMLFLAMISIASCLMWLHRLLDGFPFSVALGVAGFMSGIVLCVAGAFGRSHEYPHGIGGEILRCLLYDLPGTMLLIWLTRAIAPERLSARYVVTPLFTVLEGILLMRPRLEGRMLLGVVLLGIGAYGLLRGDKGDHEVRLSLG